jgi:hypothetical protein
MSTSKMPLKPDDFPVNAEGKKIKKQDGTPIANTEDPAVAAGATRRLRQGTGTDLDATDFPVSG